MWRVLVIGRIAGLASVLVIATGAARADTVRLRAGEHGAFTRIVADGGAAAGWMLGRTDRGYELRTAAAEGYDFSGIFRTIGRNRIAAVSSGARAGSLLLSLACDCHATAFETATGALVIDIADGPAAAGAPFEAPLPDLVDEAAGQAPDLVIALEGTELGEADGQAHDATTRSAGGTTRGFATAATADPRLALFWRGVRPLPPRSEADSGFQTASGAAGTGRAPDVPAPNQGATAPDPQPALAEDGPSTGRSPIRLPPVPDARVAEAQDELLRQLSRAAAQGLVEFEPVGRGRVETPARQGAQRGPVADHDPAGDPGHSGPVVHVETSIDRDSPPAETRAAVTGDGDACLPDELFDIASWGDERPLTVQLAEARADLVGEFDRPSPEAVRALARRYIYFGFGAEAHAVLRSFDIDTPDGDILADMGRILDGGPAAPQARFAGMADCNAAAALWAVMAAPSGVRAIDERAVVRAFSGLPAHLRRTLGPGLSARLIAAGAGDAAAAVRAAIARLPGEGGAAMKMVEARLALAAGAAEEGERTLDRLAETNDPLAVDALILTLRSRLDRGQPVEPALADTVEALAFEHRNGPQGAILAALHILARASSGDFDHAFAAFQTWPANGPDAMRQDTLRGLFAALSEKADDRSLVRHYFDHREMFEAALPDILLRLDIADRLLDAGFPSEPQRVLKGEAAYTDRGRATLARAALRIYDAGTALEQVTGIDTPEAEELRIAALSMMGDHAASAARLAQLGEDERAGREAWRAGDWDLAAEIAPDPFRKALAAIGGVERADDGDMRAGSMPNGANGSGPGPLATGRALVEQSRAIRTALGQLLAATESATD